ncbi:hypothetical protein LTR62_004978 [Meristemomyces frigidus]|uniref:Uncharacterized protein n=1 Tax=Meristemomyces frigidus TaxID=1508187 RepID=A0AAN7YTI6_9PEZI|nr:hypothetical protein LTR62_004978 [Meristemomyces frigidus]
MVVRPRTRHLNLILLLTLHSTLVTASAPYSDQSTAVVAVTATTTITQTASSANGACDNFYGACVVYGGQGTPYTTTAYATGSPATSTGTTLRTTAPTTIVTSYSTATQTVVKTMTASNSGECNNYEGACVVYSSPAGAAATTVYTSNSGEGGGNGDGEIGNTASHGDEGLIGTASGLSSRWALVFAGLVGLGALVLDL